MPRKTNALLDSFGTLKAHQPSLRERSVNALRQALFSDDRAGQGQAENLMGYLDYTPVGAATAMYDAGRSGAEGDYLGAWLGVAMAGVPGPARNGWRRMVPAVRTTLPDGIMQVYANTPHTAYNHMTAGNLIPKESLANRRLKTESGWLDLKTGKYHPRESPQPEQETGTLYTNTGGAIVQDDAAPDWFTPEMIASRQLESEEWQAALSAVNPVALRVGVGGPRKNRSINKG